MIKIKNKEKCSDCTACVSICPKNCIIMQPDDEGFLYPKVNRDCCIQCGACERVCPILTPIKETPFEQKAFLVQHLSLIHI